MPRHSTPNVEPPNPSGLCMCGCGQPTRIARQTDVREGTVRGHPRRYLSGHNPNKVRPQNLHNYIVNDDGCWIWQGAFSKGHAVARIKGRSVYVYRHFYEERHGPIAKGLHGHHTCMVESCVNPEHIEPLTPLEHRRLHRSLGGR